MITLHHGSNLPIDIIDLARSKKGKDFGQGFYLNENRDQAYKMALKTTRIIGKGKPTVTTFIFDDIKAKADGLKIKIFPDYSVEWAEFVVMNRKNKSDVPSHTFDIVIGPIADDTVGVQIRRFVMGYMSASRLIEEISFKGDDAIQYYFGTPEAISYLQLLK